MKIVMVSHLKMTKGQCSNNNNNNNNDDDDDDDDDDDGVPTKG